MIYSKFKSLCFRLTQYNLALTSNERKLLKFKNLYANQKARAFIIGNGPSLARMDLSQLKDEITIGCNGIFLLFDQSDFRPTFYTVEDRLVAEDRASIINSLTGMTKIFPEDLSYCLKKDEETIYVNFIRQYPDFPRFSENFGTKVYWGGTVTMLNLQLAYYLGIRDVYLIGVDHNYQPHTDQDQKMGNVITSSADDVNHFHPDYFGKGYRWHDPKVDRMEQAYREAKHFFESHGGKIYNATMGGNLEVFPRINYRQLF